MIPKIEEEILELYFIKKFKTSYHRKKAKSIQGESIQFSWRYKEVPYKNEE